MNLGEHESVPAELMKWVWAAGKRLPGLVRRRQAEGVAYVSEPTPNTEMRRDDGKSTLKG